MSQPQEPRPLSLRSAQRLRVAPGGLPYDRAASPCPAPAPQFSVRLAITWPPYTLLAGRERALSSVSSMSDTSQATWWTAAASFPEQDIVEPAARETRDSGMGIDCDNRRTSVSTLGVLSKRSRQSSVPKENANSPTHHSLNNREGNFANINPERSKSLRRLSTSSTPVEHDRAGLSPLVRVNTTNTFSNSSRKPISTSSSYTHPTSAGSIASFHQMHSSPPSSLDGSIACRSDASSRIVKREYRRRREETCESLDHKDEALRSRHARSHSVDSLWFDSFTLQEPIHNQFQLSSNEMAIPSTAHNLNIAEHANSILQPQTIAWKSIETLRAEYAQVDRRSRGLWGWIRTRVLCGGGVLGCRKEFWEEGDDGGSVRRYRLALPEESGMVEEKAVSVPIRVQSRGSTSRMQARDDESSVGAAYQGISMSATRSLSDAAVTTEMVISC